jgi:uncharacterized protein
VLEHSPLVCVKRVKGKGRGVFAKAPIKKGTVIEKVPVMLVPIDFIVGGWERPDLSRLFFVKDDRTLQVPMGFGCVYNHSYTPNADYDDGPGPTMLFKAIRDIAKGEEISINYNGFPDSKDPVAFKVL